jgi:hypothetical protein
LNTKRNIFGGFPTLNFQTIFQAPVFVKTDMAFGPRDYSPEEATEAQRQMMKRRAERLKTAIDAIQSCDDPFQRIRELQIEREQLMVELEAAERPKQKLIEEITAMKKELEILKQNDTESS